jgi:hypothetical protein
MIFNQQDVDSISIMLSQERLGKLIDLTGSREIAINLHQEALHVGAALMSVIATIEISLRNTTCDNLSRYFGVPNWLMQPPAPFSWRKPELKKVTMAHDSARRAEYSKLSQAEKHALDALTYPKGRPLGRSHLDRAKDRRKQIQVTHGKIVAELTLYFWKRLYGPEYEQILWRETLKRTFPYKKLKRAEIAIQLELIYQARNRLAHHEPVLHNRFHDTLKAINFITRHLEADSPSDDTSLAKLLAQDIAAAKERADALHRKLTVFHNKT